MVNIPGAFINRCGSCEYLNISDRRGTKYPCERVYGLRDVRENCCYRYSLDEMRDYVELERVNRSNCYLTTVICEILGFEDNCEILEVMREFRNNILQKNIRYLSLLFEYDTIGPLLAEELRNDENRVWIAKELLKYYIKPIIDYIKNHNYDFAVSIYQNMTELLKDNYGMGDICLTIDNYDQVMGGHGKVYKKVNC